MANIFKRLFQSKAVTDSNFYPINSYEMLGFNSFLGSNQQDLKKLINDGYGSNISVYSIISKLANTMASTPLVITDKYGDIQEDLKIIDLLEKPLIYQGEELEFKEAIEYLATFLLSTGNLYTREFNLIGLKGVQGIELIPSQIVEPVASNSYLTSASKYKVIDKQKQFYLMAEEVTHTKYVNPTSYGIDSLIGLSPLQAGLYSLTGSTDIQKALSVLVKNQGVRGVLTNESNRAVDNKVFKEFKKKINETIRGVDKINQVHVTNSKMSYLPMGMSPTDLKLIESGVLTDRQLCNMFKVDSKLFNDVGSTTFNNVIEANKKMYQDAIIPNLEKILPIFTPLINNEKQRGLKLSVDKGNIDALQTNLKEKAEKNKIVADGISVVLNTNSSIESKINMLIYSFGMSEEMASNIVGDGQGEATQND